MGSDLKSCHDCAAKPGELHEYGCDTERCPFCGGQLITCGCLYKKLGMDRDNLPEDIYNDGPTDEMEEKFLAMLNEAKRLPWTGMWPGEAECREYGFWSKFTANGWEQCDKSDPDASPDLNRLAVECRWDPEKRRYVKRG